MHITQHEIIAMLIFGTALVIGITVYLQGGINLSAIALRNSVNEAWASIDAPKSDYYIQYTKDGFVPGELEVPVGAHVAFKNTTYEPLLVESNPYPWHSDYPTFHAAKDYLYGETYTFQFNEVGTFGFHNFNKPGDHGTIHVIDPETPDEDISKTLPGQEKIRDRLIAMLVPNDPNSVFKFIDAVEADPTLANNCHEIAHDIGHKAYEMYGFSGAMNFTDTARLGHASVQDICAGGYVHGVIEEATLHQENFKNDPKVMCDGVSKDARASCFHGIGHALMFTYTRSVESSLVGCRSVGNVDDASRCFEGVWMEFFWGKPSVNGALGWDPAKPLQSCMDTEKDAKAACFLYSSFGYLRTNPKDYQGAVNLCTQSGLNASDTNYCLKGVGITMVSHFKQKHLEQSEAYVTNLTDSQKASFYKGVYGYGRLSGISQSTLYASCKAMKSDGEICAGVVGEGV
jgi:hypothetical protein